MKYAIVFGAAVAPLVAAHGMIKTPTPREAGSSLSSVCGSQIYNMLSSDAYGNIQGENQLIGSDFTAECNLWLCKGMQYADNTANLQSYTTGEEVAITYDVRAPHTGTANVSIVDTATNTIIGDQLAYWSVFASNSQAMAANESSFSITIPDLGGKCTTGGECVIQHYWNSDSAGQTYESCIDFTVGGSGSDSGSSSSAVATSAAATSAVATSTKAAASSAAATTTEAAVTSVAATTSTSKSVADVTTSSAAPTETADDDDSCDSDDGDDEDETTTTVAAEATATSAAPAATETADDDSCDSDDDDEDATTTTSAFSAEATGESGDDGEDDDSCDSDDDEPTSSAAPTTLVTRTSSRAATATATATAQPTSGSSSGSVALYGQCGGANYSGATSCSSGTCTVMNDYYSQCV